MLIHTALKINKLAPLNRQMFCICRLVSAFIGHCQGYVTKGMNKQCLCVKATNNNDEHIFSEMRTKEQCYCIFHVSAICWARDVVLLSMKAEKMLRKGEIMGKYQTIYVLLEENFCF